MNNTIKIWKYEKALKYEIFKNKEYGFAKNDIKNAKIILDIWWHIWLFSSRCRTINKDAKIYYYEPVKTFFNTAKENLSNDNKIILNNIWIAWENYDWKIIINKEKTMQTSKYKSFLNKGWEEEIVKFYSLHNVLEEINEKIDLIKMDIEWMEFEVLENINRDDRNKIWSIIIEIHIFNEEFKKNWDKLEKNLKKYYKKISRKESKYSKNIFIIFAKN